MANFTPNSELLDALISMGVERFIAEQALYKTGNNSMEAAVSYVFDGEAASAGEAASCKMVCVTNQALGMSVGKTSAQVAHACLGLYKILLRNQSDNGILLSSWEECGEKTIVLKGDDDVHLRNLERSLIEAKLPTYVVHDAGMTEVPSGSLTVLSVFGCEEDIDKITGHLTLLK